MRDAKGCDMAELHVMDRGEVQVAPTMIGQRKDIPSEGEASVI